jgi:hypothetical protein
MTMPNWLAPFIRNIQKAGRRLRQAGIRRVQRQTVEGQTHMADPR